MGFKDLVAASNKKVFLNTGTFAELRTVKYNGNEYVDIPIILADVVEEDRRVIIIQDGRRDNTQGLFMVSAVMCCAIEDIGNVQPEKGQSIEINFQEGGGGFFMEYTIDASACPMGMVRLKLEAVDE